VTLVLALSLVLRCGQMLDRNPLYG